MSFRQNDKVTVEIMQFSNYKVGVDKMAFVIMPFDVKEFGNFSLNKMLLDTMLFGESDS